MKPETQAILQILTQYLTENPQIRFGQALGNLNINQFANPRYPNQESYKLRDIYQDSDVDILKRIKL